MPSHLWCHADILEAAFKAQALGALAVFDVHCAQLASDMIHNVTFLLHSESAFRAVRPIKIISLKLVQFNGGEVSANAETAAA